MADLTRSLVGRRAHCDTDFFELLSISDSEKFDETQVKNVLRETFKGATSNPNFDFEASSLKLITTKVGYNTSNVSKSEKTFGIGAENDQKSIFTNSESEAKGMGRKFLLLHTQVYGGSKSPEEHINYLLEADKIVNENLSSVLLENGIASDVVFRQYIYYAENIEKFREILLGKLHGLVRKKIDDQSEMFIGKFLITTISTANRNISPKLGYIAEDLVHEIINYQNINQDFLKSAVDIVLSRIERIESIQRVTIQKVYLTSILPSAVMIAAIIIVFIIFIYIYWNNFINDYLTMLASMTILISIIGMGITLLYSFVTRNDVIFKK
jgi:hypothetical protein